MARVLVIAEIGINHGGSIEVAEEMIRRSKACGADIAKFQIYRPEEVLGKGSQFFEEAKKAELSREQIRYLSGVCAGYGIEFGASVFHTDTIPFTEELGIKRYKIASRSVKDVALLHEIAATGKPVILSTGGADEDDVAAAVRILGEPALLHCVPKYPTPVNEANLWRMDKLRRYAKVVGFSSHCPSMIPTIAAVAQGAQVTENHVTLSRDTPGCDVSSSIDFDEFEEMVSIVRKMEALWEN